MTLFTESKTLFHQANEQAASDREAARDLYQQAVLRLERIVREGDIRNGKIFYDIGNIHFRMNDVGRAILNYRRAEQFLPNDANLQQNLAFARARRLDRVEVAQKERVLKTLFFWHYDLSLRVRLVVLAVVALGFWAAAAVRLLRARFPAWPTWLLGMLALLLLGSVTVTGIELRRVQPGVITQAEVVARKGDSETYEPSFKDPLHAGTEFRLVERRKDWYQIELPDTRRCWLPAGSAELVR